IYNVGGACQNPLHAMQARHVPSKGRTAARVLTEEMQFRCQRAGNSRPCSVGFSQEGHMCGIIGYIGKQQALPILIEELKRLEYRGYDSAGLLTVNGHGLQVRKAVGSIATLEAKVLAEREPRLLHGSIGVAHTRWATHGAPSEENAHPHLD